MPILIDGYNLMYAAGLMKPRFGPGGLEKARRALLGLLAGSLAEGSAETTVVFDARVAPPAQPETQAGPATHGIRVQFAAGEENADALIEKLIRVDSAPKRLTVVSADHRIRTAASRRGARSVDSDTFLRELVRQRSERRRAQNPEAPEKPSGRSTSNREFWLHEFERLIDEDDLRELAGPFGQDE